MELDPPPPLLPEDDAASFDVESAPDWPSALLAPGETLLLLAPGGFK